MHRISDPGSSPLDWGAYDLKKFGWRLFHYDRLVKVFNWLVDHKQSKTALQLKRAWENSPDAAGGIVVWLPPHWQMIVELVEDLKKAPRSMPVELTHFLVGSELLDRIIEGGMVEVQHFVEGLRGLPPIDTAALHVALAELLGVEWTATEEDGRFINVPIRTEPAEYSYHIDTSTADIREISRIFKAWRDKVADPEALGRWLMKFDAMQDDGQDYVEIQTFGQDYVEIQTFGGEVVRKEKTFPPADIPVTPKFKKPEEDWVTRLDSARTLRNLAQKQKGLSIARDYCSICQSACNGRCHDNLIAKADKLIKEYEQKQSANEKSTLEKLQKKNRELLKKPCTILGAYADYDIDDAKGIFELDPGAIMVVPDPRAEERASKPGDWSISDAFEAAKLSTEARDHFEWFNKYSKSPDPLIIEAARHFGDHQDEPPSVAEEFDCDLCFQVACYMKDGSGHLGATMRVWRDTCNELGITLSPGWMSELLGTVDGVDKDPSSTVESPQEVEKEEEYDMDEPYISQAQLILAQTSLETEKKAMKKWTRSWSLSTLVTGAYALTGGLFDWVTQTQWIIGVGVGSAAAVAGLIAAGVTQGEINRYQKDVVIEQDKANRQLHEWNQRQLAMFEKKRMEAIEK